MTGLLFLYLVHKFGAYNQYLRAMKEVEEDTSTWLERKTQAMAWVDENCSDLLLTDGVSTTDKGGYLETGRSESIYIGDRDEFEL